LNWELVAYYVLGILILSSAYRVITTPRIVHAALYLALTLTGVAGIFLLLGADFLAATQVLIYVGAVTTLVVFAIMLSAPPEVRGAGGRGEPGAGKRWVGALAALAALGFAAVMLRVYRVAGWQVQAAAPMGRTTAPLGRQIFTTYVIPFEVASVVLLAALVGAIYLSTRAPAADSGSQPATGAAGRGEREVGGVQGAEEKGGASRGGTP